MINRETRQLKLMWILANLVGASLAWICYVFLSNAFNLGTLFKLSGWLKFLHQNVYVYSAVNGIIIGIAQGLIVSPQVNGIGWIIATTLGWLIGFPASVITLGYLIFSESFILFAPLSGCVLGISVGVFQSVLLLLYLRVKKAFVWILVNGVTLGFTYILILRSPDLMNPGHLDQQIVATITAGVFGLIYGFCTAGLLAELWRSSQE